MNRADKRRRRRKLVLNKLGLSLCAFAALVVLAVLGILLIRSTLLRNARDTGTALSRSFAAEESNSLAMYEPCSPSAPPLWTAAWRPGRGGRASLGFWSSTSAVWTACWGTAWWTPMSC